MFDYIFDISYCIYLIFHIKEGAIIENRNSNQRESF